MMYRSIRPTGKMTPALADREVLVDFFFPPRLDMAAALTVFFFVELDQYTLKSNSAHNRSWAPRLASQGRGASSGLRPSRLPVHPGKGRRGRGPNCLLPTKAPGQENAVVRSWLPGLLF